MNYDIIITSLFMGLIAGITHCIAMCHPFVLLISTKYTAPNSQYSLLIPHIKYNLGRTLTYTALGAAAGAFGNLSVHILVYQKNLLILAGVLLIIIAVFEFLGKRIPLPNIKILPVYSPFLMGIVLGFLPCGILLAALINAAAGANILTGALAMAMFGAGTAVALMLVALFGGFLLKYVKYTKWIFLTVFIVTGIRFIYKGLI